jgi:hypothetical protein
VEAVIVELDAEVVSFETQAREREIRERKKKKKKKRGLQQQRSQRMESEAGGGCGSSRSEDGGGGDGPESGNAKIMCRRRRRSSLAEESEAAVARSSALRDAAKWDARRSEVEAVLGALRQLQSEQQQSEQQGQQQSEQQSVQRCRPAGGGGKSRSLLLLPWVGDPAAAWASEDEAALKRSKSLALEAQRRKPGYAAARDRRRRLSLALGKGDQQEDGEGDEGGVLSSSAASWHRGLFTALPPPPLPALSPEKRLYDSLLLEHDTEHSTDHGTDDQQQQQQQTVNLSFSRRSSQDPVETAGLTGSQQMFQSRSSTASFDPPSRNHRPPLRVTSAEEGRRLWVMAGSTDVASAAQIVASGQGGRAKAKRSQGKVPATTSVALQIAQRKAIDLLERLEDMAASSSTNGSAPSTRRGLGGAPDMFPLTKKKNRFRA